MGKNKKFSKKIKGIPASSGTVKAIARIITSLSEIGRFKKGEILVTIATTPAWTPLLHIASGVITEVGGKLCHAAIVSREYGIPAVVGVKDVTRILKNGELIKLIGEEGVIERF